MLQTRYYPKDTLYEKKDLARSNAIYCVFLQAFTDTRACKAETRTPFTGKENLVGGVSNPAPLSRSTSHIQATN